MGYMHIDNLYKNVDIMMFKECYALEKVHGTSAHISWKTMHKDEEGYPTGKPQLSLFSGGMSHVTFEKLFDNDELSKRFTSFGYESTPIIVYGEAYGGKEQGMKDTYGINASFIVFDVKINGQWLDVPDAADVAEKLGLEFVPYERGSTELEWLNAQRDADSVVAIRRGMGEGKKREGVVLRPPFEVQRKNGKRFIVKHKRDDFRETRTPRPVDPKKLQVLAEANEIAKEWVTEMRLTHVLQKIPEPHTMSLIPQVIKAMVADVIREGEGEIVDSKAARKAIGRLAVALYKKRVSKIPV